jgi:nitrogen fixation protein
MSAYTAAALTLPFAAGCTRKAIDIEAQPFFFSHLVDAGTIMETGHAYRMKNQREDDENRLKELLLSNSALSDDNDSKAIRIMLVQKVNNDFKTGRIAVVNGWILALTEARQCALFSILQS